MKRLKNLDALATNLARLGVGLSFGVLIAAVLIQVVGRTAGNSPVWTEELTRFSLLFMVAFGAGLAFRTGDLVNVDVAIEWLPDRAARFLRFVAALVTVGLALFLLPHAARYVGIGAMQTSPALGIRMDFAHASIFLMLALLSLFGLLRIFGMLFASEDGRPIKPEVD